MQGVRDVRPRWGAASLLGSGEAAAAIVAGVSLLVLRPLVATGPHATMVLTGIYGAVASIALAASLRAGVATQPRRLSPATVVSVGVGVFVLGVALTGPRSPLVAGTGAPVALLLNSVAAVSEEAFFRRLVYGRVASHGAAPAVAGAALLFALVHVPLYGWAVFWVDLGAGLVFGWQRWASGRWETSAATHVAANLLAVMR